jgi:hypothetical protein
MPARPFGTITKRFEAERSARERLDAQAEQDARRAEAVASFERFCRRQRQRIKTRLTRLTERIDHARITAEDGDDLDLIVTRK